MNPLKIARNMQRRLDEKERVAVSIRHHSDMGYYMSAQARRYMWRAFNQQTVTELGQLLKSSYLRAAAEYQGLSANMYRIAREERGLE